LTSRAIFLDRDGVITKERKDYVKCVGEVEMIPHVAESLVRLNSLNFKTIIITNQSAINRGLTTHAEVAKIHDLVLKYLLSRGFKVDAVYYCPHRPDENCDCRKPKPGLFQKAAIDFDLDLKHSWLVGDKESDREAAKNTGCRFVGVVTDSSQSFSDAVSEILQFEGAKK
jgi:D-glycero-D-manno-heptose 1,7-bisphosphate phosphatase